ncbi:MAG: hypothetical protein APF84_10555 [Gracilibacter sp. BRH_c7a]|nr:MAG: hypothetical protein APF84_10555 [Gracilibacter sp. BRH_c7a]
MKQHFIRGTDKRFSIDTKQEKMSIEINSTIQYFLKIKLYFFKKQARNQVVRIMQKITRCSIADLSKSWHGNCNT